VRRAVRSDGAIVKPDTPIVPLDSIYVAEANGQHVPMVAAAYTDHGPLRTAYVFAYPRAADQSELNFKPADMGLRDETWVYEFSTHVGHHVDPGGTFTARFADPNPRTRDASAYFIVVPITRCGIAFLGDGGKFVANGRQRITGLTEVTDGLAVSVAFAADEGPVDLHGFSTTAPMAVATAGHCEPIRFDPQTHEFRCVVAPDHDSLSAKIVFSTVGP